MYYLFCSWRSFCLCRIFAFGITQEFAQYSVVLDVIPCSKCRYSADEVSDKIRAILRECGLFLDRIVAVVSDGTVLMQKVAESLQKPWIPSLTHRINLILNEVLTKADGMRTLLKTLIFNAKLISTDLELQKSFEDFQGAGTSTLFNLQKDLSSRWDIKLNLLRLMKANFDAVNHLARSSENNSRKPARQVQHLNVGDLHLMNFAVGILTLFEQVTKHTSSATETVASYIAVIVSLKLAVDKMSQGTQSDKAAEEFAKCASDELYSNPLYCRTNVLSEEKWTSLLTRIEAAVVSNEARKESANSSAAAEEPDVDGKSEMESLKKETDEHPNNSLDCFLQSFSIYEADGMSMTMTSEERIRCQVKSEMERYWNYVAKANKEIRNMPLAFFWEEHRKEFPALADFARIACAAPLGSVDCQRVFSSLAKLFKEKNRNGALDMTVRNLVLVNQWLAEDVLIDYILENPTSDESFPCASDFDWNTQDFDV
ncbi:unnamed protein product [Enterobius vermicularis]|uniref:HAT C-terminal dimerisation domain-containing protein n=1 Tax=Enterobius vermicularis TaxID=51028 RepID=A0A3P6J3P0_ENTVE|nr:unnamed protein product [Enterobius vermicularis]